MKKILFTLACASLFCACKGYLTVQPQGKVIPETDEEFAAIIHNHVNNIEGGEDQFIVGNFDGLILYESFSDNLDANVRIGAIAAYAGDKINTRQLYYKNYFSIIRDCNIVIENMSGRSSELSAKLLSASYAIKGICYYNLIRDYCDPYEGDRAELQPGLPLIDKFDMEEMPPRKALSATVAYTEELLKKSISYHTTDKMFLFTENIVKAYLAKLYFWIGDYDAVIPLCEELMQIKEYKLAGIDQYEKMIQAKNAQGQEVIVRSHINNNNDLDWYYSMIIKDLKTRPVNATLVHLFDEDKEADVRYAVSFDKKRINQKNTSAKVRGSELVLMLAESYAHQGEDGKALEQLNYLRRNRIRDVVDYTMGTLPEPDPNALIKVDAQGRPLTKIMSAIFNERRKELYLEGDRWFELKRNGRPQMWVINNGLKYTTEKYLYTAPIYKGDVDLNDKMVQNEGYIS